LGGRIGVTEKVVIGKGRQELQQQKRTRELPKSTKHGRAVWKSYDERDTILRSRKDNNILLSQCCHTNTCRPCGGQSEPCSPTSHKLEADHFSRRRRRRCCDHHACRNEEDEEAADSSSLEHQCQLQPEAVVTLQEHPQKLHVTQEKSCRTASIFRRSPAQRHTAPQICSSARTQHDVVRNGSNVTSFPHHNNMAPADVMLESTTNDDTRRRSGASGSFQSAEVPYHLFHQHQKMRSTILLAVYYQFFFWLVPLLLFTSWVLIFSNYMGVGSFDSSGVFDRYWTCCH